MNKALQRENCTRAWTSYENKEEKCRKQQQQHLRKARRPNLVTTYPCWLQAEHRESDEHPQRDKDRHEEERKEKKTQHYIVDRTAALLHINQQLISMKSSMQHTHTALLVEKQQLFSHEKQ